MANLKEPFCQELGKIENHSLPWNALLEKLAVAICLHGKAAVALHDVNVSLPHECCFLLPGSLFSKVEQSLPQQNLVPGLGSAFPPWALTRVWCVTVCSFNGWGVNNESCVCWSNADVGRAVVPNHAWFLNPFWHHKFFFLGWKLMESIRLNYYWIASWITTQ